MKSIKLFKADDFYWNPERDAERANRKLNDWLKSAVRVYGRGRFDSVNWSGLSDGNHTHTALLVCIEEIEKKKPCEHEPEKGTVHHEYIYDTSTNKTVSNKSYIKCAKCGAEIKPSGWKAVE